MKLSHFNIWTTAVFGYRLKYRMKTRSGRKVIFLLIISLFLVSAHCYGLGTSEVREFDGVRRVVFNSWGTLYVQQGERERLVIDAGKFMLTKIKTEVHGDVLYIAVSGIQTGANLRNMKFHLTLTEVKELTNHSSGKIIAGPLRSEVMELNSESSGKIEVESLEAGRLFVKIESSGDISVEGGSVGLQSVAVASSGTYEAKNLRSGAAEARLTSSGDAQMWVTGSLDAVLLSSGDLNYYGEPELIRGTTESSGDIRSLGTR